MSSFTLSSPRKKVTFNPEKLTISFYTPSKTYRGVVEEWVGTTHRYPAIQVLRETYRHLLKEGYTKGWNGTKADCTIRKYSPKNCNAMCNHF